MGAGGQGSGAGETRVCTGCGEEKPLDRRHFYRNKSPRGGYHTRCKSCCEKSQQQMAGKPFKEIEWSKKTLALAKKGNLKALAALKALNVTAIWNGKEMIRL